MEKRKSSGITKSKETYLTIDEVNAIRRAAIRAKGTKIPGPKADPVERAKFEVVQRLLKHMYSEGLTQANLAKRLGVPSSRLSKLLHNHTDDVTLDYLLRLYERVHRGLEIRIA